MELGSAIAALPFEVKTVERAREKVKEVGGMELVVEACIIAGAFESITKLVDGTGCGLPPKWIIGVNIGMMRMMKHRVAIGLVGVSVAAAYIVQKSRS